MFWSFDFLNFEFVSIFVLRICGVRLENLAKFEDLNFAANAEIGPKDFFEIASNQAPSLPVHIESNLWKPAL